MEGLPREEANCAASNTNAHYEYDPKVPSFKYYSDGTACATSVSDTRNAYNESALCDKVYHAASASVRKINYQHLLHNEAAAAAWLDNTRKEQARDLLNTPVARTSPPRQPEDMSSTVRGRRTTPTAKPTGRTILTMDNVHLLDKASAFAPRRHRLLLPESPASPSKPLLASTREELWFSASTQSAVGSAGNIPARPSENHSNKTFSISDLVPPGTAQNVLPTLTSIPSTPNPPSNKDIHPVLLAELEDDLARQV
jgi:hypothetical protein